MATISSMASRATTRRSSASATTCSSGIRATAVDIVEGQADTDTLLFNGSAGNEIFALSANGGRALFTRNLGNIVMDVNDVEGFTINALGGSDTITVNDLSGTDATQVEINLSGTIGGAAGDGAADTAHRQRQRTARTRSP